MKVKFYRRFLELGQSTSEGELGGGRWVMRLQPAGSITFRLTARHKYCGEEAQGRKVLTSLWPRMSKQEKGTRTRYPHQWYPPVPVLGPIFSEQLPPPSGLNGSPCGCSHHHQALEEAFPIWSTARHTNMPHTLWTPWRKCPSSNCVLFKRKKALEPTVCAFTSQNWKKKKKKSNLIQHKHKKMSKIKRNSWNENRKQGNLFKVQYILEWKGP